MAHKEILAKEASWLHFGQMTEADFALLEERFKFHPLDYEDIRTETPVSKVDPYKHYVFCIFHIPELDEASGLVRGRELYVFLTDDCLVTIAQEPIPRIDELYQKLRKYPKSRNAAFGKGMGYVLYKILLEAFNGSVPIMTRLVHEVSRLEDALSDSRRMRTTVELGRVRRNVLYLRHIVDPQRHALTTLSTLDRSFVHDDLRVYFDDVHDVLDTMWLTADNLKLLIDGLFDMNEVLLSHRTNTVITVLTVLSAAIMAPALIAGFYGMNVPWLPGAGNPSFVGGLYAVSVLLVLVVAAFLLGRKS